MIRRIAFLGAVALLTATLWAVRPAAGQEGPSPTDPPSTAPSTTAPQGDDYDINKTRTSSGRVSRDPYYGGRSDGGTSATGVQQPLSPEEQARRALARTGRTGRALVWVGVWGRRRGRGCRRRRWWWLRW
jgi:hypothetical protein